MHNEHFIVKFEKNILHIPQIFTLIFDDFSAAHLPLSTITLRKIIKYFNLKDSPENDKKKLPILKYMAAFGTKKTSQFAFFLWGGERRGRRKITNMLT